MIQARPQPLKSWPDLKKSWGNRFVSEMSGHSTDYLRATHAMPIDTYGMKDLSTGWQQDFIDRLKQGRPIN